MVKLLMALVFSWSRIAGGYALINAIATTSPAKTVAVLTQCFVASSLWLQDSLQFCVLLVTVALHRTHHRVVVVAGTASPPPAALVLHMEKAHANDARARDFQVLPRVSSGLPSIDENAPSAEFEHEKDRPQELSKGDSKEDSKEEDSKGGFDDGGGLFQFAASWHASS